MMSCLLVWGTVWKFEVLFETVRYFWELWDTFGNLEVLLGTLGYFRHFEVLFGYLRYFWELWGTFGNFKVLLRPLIYFWEFWGTFANIEVLLRTLRYTVWNADVLSMLSLTNTEPPDAPGNLNLKEKGSRYVVLEWITPFDGNSPLTQFIIEYQNNSGKIFNLVLVCVRNCYLYTVFFGIRFVTCQTDSLVVGLQNIWFITRWANT